MKLRSMKKRAGTIEVCFKRLPTSFRVPYSVSMDSSVVDLLRKLANEYEINVSREIEPLIKKWAARTARKINENQS